MLFNVLVINAEKENKSASRGTVVSFKESSKPWGKMEKPPRFKLIPFEGTEEEAKYICSECRYDFDQECFVTKDSDVVFDKDMVTEEPDGSYDEIFSEEAKAADVDAVRELNNGQDTDDPCKFLNPFGRKSAHQQRVYFLKKLYSMKNLPGMETMITLIKTGTYGELRAHMKTLPPPTKIIMKQKLTDEEYEALHNDWGVL
jgi:hypothetical protein